MGQFICSHQLDRLASQHPNVVQLSSVQQHLAQTRIVANGRKQARAASGHVTTLLDRGHCQLIDGAEGTVLLGVHLGQVGAFFDGQVARECAVERKVAESYFGILEDLLLAHRVPIFSRRSRRRLAAHDKFYFFDVGVYRTLRPQGPLDQPEEIEGAALETLYFQELRAINALLDCKYTIYYWRTATGLEADFVLYGPRGLLAIEASGRPA